MPMHSPQQSNIIGYELNRYPSAEIEKSSCTPKEEMKQGPAEEELRGPTIRFNVRVAVKDTIHRNDFTAEEISHAWYRKNDFPKMKHAFAYTVQLLAAGRYEGDTDEMTSRGLEYRHRAGAMRRKTNKLNALYAVLDEQERQWREGYDSDEEIRAMYLQNSIHCGRAAQVIAQNDEDECKRINDVLPDPFPEDDDDAMSMSSDMSCQENMHMHITHMGMHITAATTAPKPVKKKTSGFTRFFQKGKNSER